MVHRKTSRENSRCFSDYGLSIKSFNAEFRVLVSAQIAGMETFFDVEIAIFRFWRMVSKKNSEKIPNVPLTKTYESSNLTLNLVP